MRALLRAALVALVFPIADVAAQTASRPPERQIGFIAATGFARVHEVGYHGLVGLEARTPVDRLRFRAEALFADLGGNEKTSALALTATASALAGSQSPYLLASWAMSPRGGWQRGFSVGAGWRFAVAERTAFAEARAYSFHDPARAAPSGSGWRYVWVPVSLGLRF